MTQARFDTTPLSTDYRNRINALNGLVKQFNVTSQEIFSILTFQGEVEQISLMKPKAETEHDEGMLEYLEDIIGSSKYKEPIEQIAKSVEELNEARGEKVSFSCF